MHTEVRRCNSTGCKSHTNTHIIRTSDDRQAPMRASPAAGCHPPLDTLPASTASNRDWHLQPPPPPPSKATLPSSGPRSQRAQMSMTVRV